MNILFSFGYVITPTKGGTERAASLIATYLQRQGHRIMYLVTEEQGIDELEEKRFYMPRGLSLSQKREWVKDFCLAHRIDVIINEAGTTDDVYFLSKDSLPSSIKVITCLHFDILGDLKYFYSNYNYSFRGLGLKESVLKMIQILRLPLLKRMHTRNRRIRYRYAAEHSDKVVVLSPASVQDYLQFTGLPDDGKVICISNPNSFDVPDDISLSEKENIILFVGRVTYSPKKVHRILEFWRELHVSHPDWKLQIVGDGDDLPRCKKLATKWKLPRVEFVGATSNVQQYYRKARILVLTSDFEGTPMVIPEAQAYGCVPIIYNSFAGASLHIQQGKNGYLIPKFNKVKFKNQLKLTMSTSICHYSEIQHHLIGYTLDKIGIVWEKLLLNVKP